MDGGKPSRETILAGIRHCLENSLDIKPEEVKEEAFLARDLGVTSIDMVDLIFNLRRSFGLTIDMADVQKQLLGGLSEQEFFNPDGAVTARGYQRIAELAPGFDRSRLREELTNASLFEFFQVRHLVDLIEQNLPHTRTP